MFEEDPRSIISHIELSIFDKVSDSNSTTRRHHLNPPNSKRARFSTTTNNTSTSSKFKGVVPQQNGHWGCQIYANHQRIWLGTFKTESEAATAYDSAALKLRSGNGGDNITVRRNFPLNTFTAQEPEFQTHHTLEAILSMIKDGTYQSKFAEFIISRVGTTTELTLNLPPRPRMMSCGDVSCRRLFQKELTPSDVSKLNRLVIPKKYAVKYFPRVPDEVVASGNNNVGEEESNLLLSFYDSSLRTLWKFRYCYWKSSQSFVFTRGWNRFVKENGLKANDTITFCLCERHGGGEVGTVETFFMIDASNCKERGNPQPGSMVNLQLGSARRSSSTVLCSEIDEIKEQLRAADDEKKGIKLFGVTIA
ncbi:unnamed protein product [Linum tenue]|uniref:Uncharacterized protein n=1 Tax=Linum tenue TaxID=586396 RepID=A0AAV0IAX1_9ROSI|nr:unnamed protein product [Linum tenue]CAI0394801.1 unnamed protein product [Linum tenue]